MMSENTQANVENAPNEARFDDIDVGVTVDLPTNSAQRDIGFDLSIDDLSLVNPNDGIATEQIISEGVAGNLYFNFHTTDFPTGELRGQLQLVADNRNSNGVGTLEFSADLSGDQEVPTPADTDASGTATAIFTVASDDSITYSTDVSLSGLNQADLLPVNIGNGTLSPIHLHNAAAGENGPVVVDVASDAGPDGIEPISETFSLDNVLNVVGSNDADIITGDANDNTLSGLAGNDTINGNAGDDFIAGGGGTDSLDGGDGIDTNSFFDIGAEVIADLNTGSASYQPNVEAGITVFETFANFENLDGSPQDDQLFGDAGNNRLSGNDGNDLLSGRGGDDRLRGGLGNDILQGGGGNDLTDGGEGIDTADFQDIGVDVKANLATGQAQYQVNGNQVQDRLVSIENLTGSTNNDILIGDENANLLAGNAGNDTLVGGDGDDILRGDEIGAGTAIRVTVTNTLEAGGTFLTPIWFGFHDGANFDLFNLGEAASTGLERLTEDGSIEGIAAEFNAQVGDNGIDGTIVGGEGVPGPIDPGESASFTLDVDPAAVGQGFFTWGTMIIPSNDAFLSVPDDALADPIFDEHGNFIGPLTIERRGSDVLDAGTEVNTEEDAAFINQSAPNTGIDENGVVALHPGFNGSVGNPDGTPVNILGGTTASGATIDPLLGDFTADDDLLLQIEIEQVAVANAGNDVLKGGNGDDILEGGGGNDILTGGRGHDTFRFERNAGKNTVTDFSTSDDVLDVGSIFNNFEDVVGAASQSGHNTVIDFGNNNSVLLLNVSLNELNSNSFAFS